MNSEADRGRWSLSPDDESEVPSDASDEDRERAERPFRLAFASPADTVRDERQTPIVTVWGSASPMELAVPGVAQ